MIFLKKRKDGGPESKVTGYWLIELKNLFSIAILKFENGSREAYHSHAFNCISWIINSGTLIEDNLYSGQIVYKRSVTPILTFRKTFHKVTSIGTTWVITFRGPWADRWSEFLPEQNKFIVLTHKRKIVNK